MKPIKERSMLLDVQYVKENKKNGTPDFLYIIWKDLDTGEKYMQAVPEPKMDIFFEKPEFRDFDYNKNYEFMNRLNKRSVKYKDIPFVIAEEMGEEGKRKLSQIFSTRNFKDLKQFFYYPYVFGADYDIRAWYRSKWLETLDNDRVKKLDKGFFDIEADGIDVEGMVNPIDCPVNAMTLIDVTRKQCYTFLLVGRECVERDITSRSTTKWEYKNEVRRRKLYESGLAQQQELMDNVDEFKEELKMEFDDKYGEMNYNLYFYKDERKMLVHIFELINKISLDTIGIWNISFDIPYLIERCEVLGLDPAEVMCGKEFPVKQCYFKKDMRNFEVKNKSDYFNLSSKTIFYDQMVLYAAIRKGQQELRAYKLNYIAKKELKDEKLDYSEDGTIKTLPYTNFKKFVMYNIKDVLLQYGIEKRTTDFDTLYVSSYRNATPYDSVFKQTVKLRNVQLVSYAKQNFIPGMNINSLMAQEKPEEIDDEDDESEKTKFEGALVADPVLNGYVGTYIYGRRSNNIFRAAIDMDMAAFYPNSIIGMNIDPSTLIFKCIVPATQFDVLGGQFKLRSLTHNIIKDDYAKGMDDIGKELFDNLQSRNYLTLGFKALHLPSVVKAEEYIMKKLEKEGKQVA